MNKRFFLSVFIFGGLAWAGREDYDGFGRRIADLQPRGQRVKREATRVVDSVEVRLSPTAPDKISWPYGIDLDLNSNVWFVETQIADEIEMKEYICFLLPNPFPERHKVPFFRCDLEKRMEPASYPSVISEYPSAQVVEPILTQVPAETARGIVRWLIPDSMVGAFNLEADSLIWFTEGDTGAIGCFNPETGELREWFLPWEEAMPVAIMVTEEGVWFTDPDRAKVGRLDPEMNRVTGWQIPGCGWFGLGWPGLDMDAEGNIWLTERREYHALIKMELDSYEWATFYIYRIPGPVFDGPCDLMVDDQGYIWYDVMGVDEEYERSRVGFFDEEALKFAEWDLPAEGLSPYYLEMDQNRHIFFPESDIAHIGRLDPEKNELCEVSISMLTGRSFIHDIALAPSGEVWFTNTAGYVGIPIFLQLVSQSRSYWIRVYGSQQIRCLVLSPFWLNCPRRRNFHSFSTMPQAGR